MDDMIRLSRSVFLLKLASEQIELIENQSEAISQVKNDIHGVMKKIAGANFAGPHGFDPEPTFEKCDRCDQFRLRK